MHARRTGVRGSVLAGHDARVECDGQRDACSHELAIVRLVWQREEHCDDATDTHV